MWQQDYTPLAGSLGLSAAVAALPIFVLLWLLGVKRKPAWIAGVVGLGSAIFLALAVYRMPAGALASAVGYGAAFGLFPIGWIVFWAIVLYRITVDTGSFEVIKDTVGSLTADRRLQALLIAFALSGFIEGAAGFGTPVAVAAAMMAGLGFKPFFAGAICLLGNTSPVAFGSIGIPIVTLAGITAAGFPDMTRPQLELALSGATAKILAPVSLFVPAYMVMVMGGVRGLVGVWPGVVVCGAAFAATQYYMSTYQGPQISAITSSGAAIVALVILLRFWQPSDQFKFEGNSAPAAAPRRHSIGRALLAWSPYLLLVAFVLVWGQPGVRAALNSVTRAIDWPGLHNLIERMPPVVAKPAPYAAVYNLNWLSAAGTACLLATIASAIVLRVSPARYVGILAATSKQLKLPMLTIAAVLALAFLMNYCGATATLGLAFAATGALFPFFSSMLGWLGVFLTGSDTSSNALFGNLQVITATRLSLDPVLMAASNAAGGVMGKMISLQSIAVAAAATGLSGHEEARLFRFTLRHSIVLASAIGLVTALWAYALR
jgi:L-lactate transport